MANLSSTIKIEFDPETVKAIQSVDKRIKKIEKELSRLTGRKI